MKIRKIAALFGLSLLLGACNNDDSNLDLVGNWKLSALEMENTYDINNDGESSLNLLDESDCNLHTYFIFHEGSSTCYLQAKANLTIAHGTEGSNVICNFETDAQIYTWKKTGDTSMQIKSTSFDWDYYNAQVVGNELRYTITNGIQIPVNNGGELTYISESLTYVYRR